MELSAGPARPTLVTVILPTHSDPGTLTYAIQSVLNQSHVDLELRVVCDGATKETLEVVKTWASRDSRVLPLQFAKGPNRGWNNRVSALKTSKGKYLFYIDEDDLWLPNHIESLVPLLEERDSDFASSSLLTVTPDGGFELAIWDHSGGLLRSSDPTALYVMDTQIAHSRKSYDAFVREGVEPLAAGPRGLIRAYMASTSVKWSHLPQITAISLPGTPRVSQGISNTERVRQIGALAESVASGQLDSASAMNQSSVVSHLWGLFHDFPPRDNCTSVATYLAMLAGNESEADLLTWNALNLDQKELAEVTLRFFRFLGRGLFPTRREGWITEGQFREIVASLQRIVAGPPPLDRKTAIKWLTFFEK